MRHYLIITFAILLVASLFYCIVDSMSDIARAAMCFLTITGLVSLVVVSAYNAPELRKGS